MKLISNRRIWLAGGLAAVLALFAWIFGWGGGQDPADTEVSYWIEGRPSSRFGSTCRGSMELIDDLLKRAPPVKAPSW